jgi:hypothetical protein
MNLRQQTLRFYRRSLYLYPKRFRKLYGEQMLITAYDILQIPTTNSHVVQVAARLGLDLIISACVAHIQHIKKTLKDQKWSRAFSAVVLACQIVGMAVVTFLVLVPVTNVFTVMRHAHMTVGPWYLQLVVSAVPAAMVLVAFMALGGSVWLSVWQKIKWAYVLGFLGGVSYVVLATIEDHIAQSLYYRFLPQWDETTLLQAYGHDWTVAMIALISFWLAVRNIKRLLKKRQTAKALS